MGEANSLPGHMRAEILEIVEASVNAATIKASKQALQMVSEQSTDMLSKAQELAQGLMVKVKEGLKEIEVTRPQILKIEVDGVQADMEGQAVSKYLERVIINSKLGLNTMLVGEAGTGKTILAGQVAKALKLEYGHTTLTAGASETWLFGRQTPKGFVEGSFSIRYRNGGVFLADEMDGADPNMLLVINTALANGSMYNPISGEVIQRHKDFIFLGACNTVGKGADMVYSGRNRLDGATLDRFVLIRVDYDPDIEKIVCPHDVLRDLLQSARKKLRKLKSDEIMSTRGMQKCYKQLAAGVDIKDIITSLVMGWPPEIAEQCGLDPKKVPSMNTAPALPEAKPKPITPDEVKPTDVEYVPIPTTKPVKRMRRPKAKLKTYLASEKCTCAHVFSHHSDGVNGPCMKNCTCRRFVPLSEAG